MVCHIKGFLSRFFQARKRHRLLASKPEYFSGQVPDIMSNYFFKDLSTLPVSDQHQLQGLTPLGTKALTAAVNDSALLKGCDSWGNQPFQSAHFAAIEYFYVNQNWPEVCQWLKRLPVADKGSGYFFPMFSSDDEVSIKSNWSMICKYPEIFFDGDNLFFIHESMQWILFYHHDGRLEFAQGPNYSLLHQLD